MRPPGEPAGDAAGTDARRRIESLYRSEAPGLARRLRAKVGSTEEARELVHDAFARLLGARGFERVARPEAFLSRVVRNLLIDRSRRGSARATHVPLCAAPDIAVPPEQDHGIALDQMRERYRHAVAALPERMRDVFVLHRVEELSYRQIAERCGISIRTVEKHMAEAIVRLDRELGE